MQLPNILAMLASATLTLSAAVPTLKDEFLATRGKPTQYVKYCKDPAICATMAIDGECQTFAQGFPLLTFPAGVSCDVYSEGSCMKEFLSRDGKVSNVEGFFDATTDPRAIKNKVSSVGSFICCGVHAFS